jgi:hypothetical protein
MESLKISYDNNQGQQAARFHWVANGVYDDHLKVVWSRCPTGLHGSRCGQGKVKTVRAKETGGALCDSQNGFVVASKWLLNTLRAKGGQHTYMGPGHAFPPPIEVTMWGGMAPRGGRADPVQLKLAPRPLAVNDPGRKLKSKTGHGVWCVIPAEF